ncbi:MAG: LYR motif-containing protein [archaeon]|nr:LYR motif-containing protein [archaeon]
MNPSLIAPLKTPQTVRGLYRSFLRLGGQFQDYNFREFAIRKARCEFRASQPAAAPPAERWEHAVEQLQMLRRQVIIDNLYSHRQSN